MTTFTSRRAALETKYVGTSAASDTGSSYAHARVSSTRTTSSSETRTWVCSVERWFDTTSASCNSLGYSGPNQAVYVLNFDSIFAAVRVAITVESMPPEI